MILFSDIGEVITSAVMDFVTVSFCSSREDRKAKASLGKAALRWCCVFSQVQGRGAVTLHTTVCLLSLSATAAVAWDSTFLGGEWSSGGVFTQKGFELLGASQKKGHNPWVSVSLVLPTTVHLQGGWDLLQPLPAKAAPSSCHNSWCFWVSSTDSPGPVPRQGSAATDAFLIRP